MRADRYSDEVGALHTAVMPITTPTLEQTTYCDGLAYLDVVASLSPNSRPMYFLRLSPLSATCGFPPHGMPASLQTRQAKYRALFFRIGHRFQMDTMLHK